MTEPLPPLLSGLDLSPLPAGFSSADALRHTLDLAPHADAHGYTRYWLAEHHNTPLIASSVPEIMIGHIAIITTRIRVGSGGVMLPNHAPLKVVETFRMLEALHPRRIDPGICAETDDEAEVLARPATLRRRLTDLARQAGVGEIMITTMIHEHVARRQSYRLLAQAFGLSTL